MGWFMRRLSELCCVLLCLSLLGCGSAPEKRNALSAETYRHHERAVRAYARGNLPLAAAEYQLALRGAEAIEDAAAIAVARINLARVWRESSHYEQSHQQLAALFAAPQLAYPAASLAAAAILQGQLYLEQEDVAAATEWAARGEQTCQSRCEVRPSLQLLRAQLAMRAHHQDEANKLVEEAIGGLNSPAQAVEQANALRLSGELAYAAQDDARATTRFEQALALDLKLGLPLKIRLDLSRLAQTAARAGRAAEAANYAARAAAVGRASAALIEPVP